MTKIKSNKDLLCGNNNFNRWLLLLHILFFNTLVILFQACQQKIGLFEPDDQIPQFPASTLIPLPVSYKSTDDLFNLSAETGIYIEPANEEIRDIGQYLADKLNPATGYEIQIQTASGIPTAGNIYLKTLNSEAGLGEEGYQLTITNNFITLVAYKPAGLFWGIQTIRQLLPSSIEYSTIQPGPWTLAGCTIRDYPRFSWRGAMLDVARHFFSVEDVKRYLDLMAYYKLNRFHLHLTDDQGWRIMIDSWPDLALTGGSTEVGGGMGGYYSKKEYADIVDFADQRYVVVVPEIDMPGHTNAALASYAQLNCNGMAPDLYTGTDVGFSSLCTDKEITYTFIDDVIREIAGLTTGSYIHIGGDEASLLGLIDYVEFITRIQTIVQSHGKQMIGWEEIAQTILDPSTITQHWYHDNLAISAAQQGVKVIMSPASRTYLDMKYDAFTPLGQSWAGYTDLQDAYTWDPVTQVNGLTDTDILGLEAPLWTETIETIDNIEFMAFPRLAGHAEIGWSPGTNRNWQEYKMRLAAHGGRLTAMDVDFYQSSKVPWYGLDEASQKVVYR